MKRLVMLFPDAVDLSAIDLGKLAALASEFKIETLETGKARYKKRHVNGKSTHGAIMEHYTPSGSFSKKNAMEWMEKAGFNPTSANPALSYLARNGYLRRSGNRLNARYHFVKKFDAESAPPAR